MVSAPRVRVGGNPPGLAIGGLTVAAVEHGGRWWAEVPPLGRLEGASLEDLAGALQDALDAFHARAQGLAAEDMERALEAAHGARARALARQKGDTSLAAAREAREAAQRYALLVLLLMPLLADPAPRWRLGR